MALIHTCYRITDIDRSIAFYDALGFEEVGRIPIRDEAVNVFMNQPGDGDMPRLELTYNFGVDSYEIGTAYGHIAITAARPRRDARAAGRAGHRAREAALQRARGRLAARASSEIPMGTGSRFLRCHKLKDQVTRFTCVLYPDGYRVELIETA